MAMASPADDGGDFATAVHVQHIDLLKSIGYTVDHPGWHRVDRVDVYSPSWSTSTRAARWGTRLSEPNPLAKTPLTCDNSPTESSVHDAVRTLQAQLATELRIRTALLPQEMADWQAGTLNSPGAFGIHRSQIQAITLLLEGLLHKQAAILTALDPSLPPSDFSHQCLTLGLELTRNHAIFAIFRHIFAQRHDPFPQQYDYPRYRRILDAADLIAADCYSSAIQLACDWTAFAPQHMRAPPLTYLNASESALAFTGQHVFRSLGFPLHAHLDLKLPISIIALPYDYSAALWTFCAVYHEVGHIIDQDLGIRAAVQSVLADQLLHALPAALPWTRWLGEIIADTFGVLFGGLAFAYALRTLLFLSAPEDVNMATSGVHPPASIRFQLTVVLVRNLGIRSWDDALARLEAEWQAIYGTPPSLQVTAQHLQHLAALLLDAPLSALAGHRMREFGPAPASDHYWCTELSHYLRTGLRCPDQLGFPIRLVPAAAQLALQPSAAYADWHLQQLQVRAIDFIEGIPRPDYLGPTEFSAERSDYLRGLVAQLPTQPNPETLG